jgi:two-component system, chemotaxis family, CheB/CheR fusion protein
MKAIPITKKSPTKKKANENSFPIVAIGASAGGLESMMELLKYLPHDTGMAFIYVQHLSPDHKSMLTEILSKKTKIKVQEIDDMDKIRPDNVFIIPYNKGIEVTDGHIKLIPRSESTTPISVDILFSSLAQAQKERVIGIILSGSGSDGTLGLKDIKHEGGLTFAQDDSAKFNSMPHSAIAAGVVDFILSPKEIALELTRLSNHPFVKINDPKSNTENLIENNNPDLKNILNQLHKTTGVNFSAYKMNTIKRRIMRRMLLYKIDTLKQYAKLLTQKNEEIDILYQDLLINVTSFFRDTHTHKYLKESLFPKLLKRKKPGESLRIWVPACSTGEEAYSIAMILLEIQGGQSTTVPFQIFATDLSGQAISKARIGVYSKQDLETVSPKRIQQFFTKADNNFRVNKTVREMCVFAQHNILSDPPFSRLDFISCCNLFIYLDTAAQKKVVNTFHYALKEDGFLMLGKSENISHSTNLFTSINKKHKIFSRKINASSQRLPELSPRFTQPIVSKNKNPLDKRDKTQINISGNYQGLDKAIDEVLISEFMPASVVIDHQMEIVQFRGTTDLFLTHPKGKATFSILKMARPEIAFELRNAIAKVIKSKKRFRKTGIEFKVNSDVKIVSIEIVPLAIERNEPLLLILFTVHEQVEGYTKQTTSKKSDTSAKDRRIIKLEQELADAHAQALSFSQDQEAVTEELQSANEEVVSSNEELQTLNEELETSKEEIESANEELITTNQELQTRNDLLNESYEYSNAIVSTMHEPMLVLGKDFRVKSANQAFYKKFGVTEEQTLGVLLYDLGNKQWNIPLLQELLEDIIPKNSHFFNYEVKHTFLNIGEKIMSLNASRVIQNAHREQLILLIIADITEVRHLIVEKELRDKEKLTREISDRKAEKLRLEKAVNERTQELKEANEALEEKNKALINMNKELEAFAYVSSHDLQEPLRKIQTFAGIILENENQNLTEKGKNYFHLMRQSAERMQQLIKDLLAFSSLSAAERKFENTDLSTIIEEVKKDFNEEIAEKNAVIDVIETCEVHIIPFQFRQLIHNLISNALKFSNPNIPPHIKISSRHIKYEKLKIKNLPFQKEYCHISVTDNGIGFEKEFSTKIFDVFQKLHGKDEYKGTGIGLAVVKKIMDNHNGIIKATSSVNKGTTFDIYLPTNP